IVGSDREVIGHSGIYVRYIEARHRADIPDPVIHPARGAAKDAVTGDIRLRTGIPRKPDRSSGRRKRPASYQCRNDRDVMMTATIPSGSEMHFKSVSCG